MEQSISYQVTDVTVFPDRARVSCLGSTQIEPAVDTLLFDELPLGLETESVRVSGSGDVPVRIISVDVVRQHYERSPSPKIASLEMEIESATEELGATDDEIAAWQAEADSLNGLRNATDEYAKGLSRGRMSIEDQNELMTYMRARDREIRKEQRALGVERRALLRRIEKLERELAELRSAQPRLRYRVRVNVAVEGEGQFHPALTYVVGNARWQALYDLRLVDEEEGPSLEITASAQVSQQTGQDWNDIRVKVSTARPALNQRIPELDPWYIDVYTPPIPRSADAPQRLEKAQQMVFAQSARESGAMMDQSAGAVEAQIAEATVQSESAIVSYAIEGACTIPSDGSPRNFVLSRFFPPVVLIYLCVPKHTDAVFRQATVTNTNEAPLLSGAANLFVNDEFIGKTRIDYTPAEGELELLLGVEERIEVSRELARRSVDKKFLKDHRVVNYGYEIKIKNLLSEPTNVELREQLPISRHEEIQVKLDDVKPAPSEQTELNILKWKLEIDPGTETIVRYSYFVQHPRSMRIIGMVD